MPHQLYDIWKEDDEVDGVAWCVQLVKYVGYFPNRETAELYVKVLKEIKKRGGA